MTESCVHDAEEAMLNIRTVKGINRGRGSDKHARTSHVKLEFAKQDVDGHRGYSGILDEDKKRISTP